MSFYSLLHREQRPAVGSAGIPLSLSTTSRTLSLSMGVVVLHAHAYFKSLFSWSVEQQPGELDDHPAHQGVDEDGYHRRSLEHQPVRRGGARQPNEDT